MFFCAHLGRPEHQQAWLEAVNRHAVWLGLTAHMQSRRIGDGRVFTFGWLSAQPPDTTALVQGTARRILVTTLPTPSPPAGDLSSRRGFETDVAQMEVSLDTGAIKVAMPVATLQEMYYSGKAGGHAFSDDLRLMIRWAGLDLDERAVYALFEFHLVPPTLTLSRRVIRLPVGHWFELLPRESEPTMTLFFQPPAEPLRRDDHRMAEALFREALDGVLARVPISSVVSFSGGVDSGLIAARLAALGRKDITLLNVAVGRDDPYSERALAIASAIGLRCEQIVWSPSSTVPTLMRIAKEYGSVFADPASVLTLSAVDVAAAMSPQPPMLLDGAGETSLFTDLSRYRRARYVYAPPRPVRWLASQAYRRVLWKQDSKLARLTSDMHRSLYTPLWRAGTHGYTHLNAIAYQIPRATRAEIEEILAARYDVLAEGLDPLRQRAIMLSQRLEIAATRLFDPLRARGIRPMLPYIQPDVMGAGFSLSQEERNPGGESKGLMKRLLAQSMPPQSPQPLTRGFLLPFTEAFSTPGMADVVHEYVLSGENPLLDFCNVATTRRIFERALQGEPMETAARRFAWTLVFASTWLKEIQKQLP